MPGKLRRLSGDEAIAILSRLGFEIFSQRGSHVKLRRYGLQGEKQTLVVPRHEELDVGLCGPSSGIWTNPEKSSDSPFSISRRSRWHPWRSPSR